MTKPAMVFALAVALAGGAGLLLDRTFDTRPWLACLGVFLGAAAGLIGAYATRPRRQSQPIYTPSGSRRTPD